MPRRPSKQQGRIRVREALWPGAERFTWPLVGEKGWCRTPRSLPVVAEIINNAAGGGVDLLRTYLTLYCRAFDEGVVDLEDEQKMADLSGLRRKSWIARMTKLRELHLIDIKARGSRRFGYALLIHPVAAVRLLRAEGKVPDHLFALFEEVHAEFGGTEPADLQPAAPVDDLRGIDGERFRMIAEAHAGQPTNPFTNPRPPTAADLEAALKTGGFTKGNPW